MKLILASLAAIGALAPQFQAAAAEEGLFDLSAPEPVIVDPIRIELPEPNVPTLAEQAEIDCLASAIHFEARGEPTDGQIAVVEVVLARKANPRWPATACGVIAQRAQFSFVKRGKVPKVPHDCHERHSALAREVVEGRKTAGMQSAVYFHADYVAPSWRKRVKKMGQIGNHIFYSAT
ncbi:cell wall hydrolase [Croceicoccus gelatinilyticus]|uniref:cell wall hydrolase n=1 Tax=Croceicoccus gelatinilyticus TaxID=2835536 RepID=UPI001BCEF9A8|nr:cell wall hydrolase [Croceicoccus gelatinilyticus]MBS7671380.1 cell wall hydrolase [Croceicoccus gelatinilyticus]